MRDDRTDKVAAFMNEQAVLVQLFTEPEEFAKFMCNVGGEHPQFISEGALDTSFIWPCGYGRILVNWYNGQWRAKYESSVGML